mmetsp:Transcript_18560/g.20638  ORF Transcript_18560/g.20638 Transcript_18560/m.20638 type:complete len:507 (+) Transcript_18560:67-1587(+)
MADGDFSLMPAWMRKQSASTPKPPPAVATKTPQRVSRRQYNGPYTNNYGSRGSRGNQQGEHNRHDRFASDTVAPLKEIPTDISQKVYTKEFMLSIVQTTADSTIDGKLNDLKSYGLWTDGGVSTTQKTFERPNKARNTGRRKHTEDTKHRNSLLPKKKEPIDIFVSQIQLLLNKLTVQKFDSICNKLSTQFKKIDSPELMGASIDVLCKKARWEPQYSALYSRLCSMLNDICPSFKDEKTNKPITCRRVLLNRCQEVFETTYPKDLHPDSEEFSKARQYALGNIVFIAELYKSTLIPYRIVAHCISFLITSVENSVASKEKSLAEEYTEKLCKFLTVAGEALDKAKSTAVDVYIEKMTEFEKSSVLGSRIKFMIADLKDLRTSSWKPRMASAKAKPRLNTTDQALRDQAEQARMKKQASDVVVDNQTAERQVEDALELIFQEYFTSQDTDELWSAIQSLNPKPFTIVYAGINYALDKSRIPLTKMNHIFLFLRQKNFLAVEDFQKG